MSTWRSRAVGTNLSIMVAMALVVGLHGARAHAVEISTQAEEYEGPGAGLGGKSKRVRPRLLDRRRDKQVEQEPIERPSPAPEPPTTREGPGAGATDSTKPVSVEGSGEDPSAGASRTTADGVPVVEPGEGASTKPPAEPEVTAEVTPDTVADGEVEVPKPTVPKPKPKPKPNREPENSSPSQQLPPASARASETTAAITRTGASGSESQSSPSGADEQQTDPAINVPPVEPVVVPWWWYIVGFAFVGGMILGRLGFMVSEMWRYMQRDNRTDAQLRKSAKVGPSSVELDVGVQSGTAPPSSTELPVPLAKVEQAKFDQRGLRVAAAVEVAESGPDQAPAGLELEPELADESIVYDSAKHIRLRGGAMPRVDVEDRFPYRTHNPGLGFAVSGVSVRGASHIKARTRCQDAHRCLVLRDGTVVAAVADGVGSMSLSDIGARVATGAALASIVARLSEGRHVIDDEQVLREAVVDARAQLAAVADRAAIDQRELATTILLAVVRNGFVRTAHIGDGAMVGRVDGEWVVLSAPEQSRHVNDVTPLTSEAWEQALRIAAFDHVDAVYLVSDGLERSCVSCSRGQQFRVNDGFFDPVHDAIRQANTVSDATRLLGRTLGGSRLDAANDDDKTLVALWKTGTGAVIQNAS